MTRSEFDQPPVGVDEVPFSTTTCLRPDWRVAPRVRAFVTTRAGGISQPPFGRYDPLTGQQSAGGMNLGMYAGDDPIDVLRNRKRLTQSIGMPIAWLRQVHGTTVVQAAEVLAQAQGYAPDAGCEISADACVTDRPGVACAVMVADCMPVLLCRADGAAVGAAHAGWRGLVGGVIEQTAAALEALGKRPDRAFLGPAIGARVFEVGPEVRQAFLDAALPAERDATAAAFLPHTDGDRAARGKSLGDLVALAKLRLARVGIAEIGGGNHCTVEEPERFYSYRRDGTTGRMAALIWLDEA